MVQPALGSALVAPASPPPQIGQQNASSASRRAPGQATTHSNLQTTLSKDGDHYRKFKGPTKVLKITNYTEAIKGHGSDRLQPPDQQFPRRVAGPPGKSHRDGPDRAGPYRSQT
jgi:hypothetical protein